MEQAGLYFHIPFCRNKCPYCDFYSVKHDETAEAAYCARLTEEIKQYTGSFDTVYFGGGTPSVLAPQLIGSVLAAAREQYEIDADSEITIECNPSKDLSEAFRLYRSYGINRISLGMQSAVDKERFALGRSAGKAEVAKAVADAKNAGIENISLDLMLGTPKQTLASLDETFDFIDKMQVQHISAYLLKIEEGTKFAEIQHRLALPEEDETAKMYLKTVQVLGELGLRQYEISNFAKPNFESRHNLKYWQLVPYLGIGKSAHSFWGGRRFYYDREFRLIPDGNGGGREEAIMLGLRLTEGIQKSLTDKPYQAFVKAGLMRETDERIALTPQGMLVSNAIINALI